MSTDVAKRVFRNVQRALDKQRLREKYGKRGRLMQIVDNRSKLNQQIDEALKDHVKQAKSLGSPLDPLEETRKKLDRIKLNYATSEHNRTANQRAHHLTNFLSNYLINAFQSGTIGSELMDKYPLFQISRLILTADMNKIEIHWLTNVDETVNENIESNLLSRFGAQVRHELISNHVIGYVPPVIFVRDNSKAILDQLDELLALGLNKNNKQEKPAAATAKVATQQQEKEDETKIEEKKEKLTNLINNVYGIDHTKLVNEIKPAAAIATTTSNSELTPALTSVVDIDQMKKFDLTVKAMRINQKIKKEKQSKTALLQLALREYEHSKHHQQQQENNKKDEDE